jgi:FAD/FMN-containing dehydrogenase
VRTDRRDRGADARRRARILGRKHGLTCDRLLAAQVVLADGRVVDCDEHHNPDLFWALRGAGGGQFGVVTSLAFQSVPAPAATTFHLVWPAGDAAAVIEAWQDWAPDAPDELNASLRLTTADDRDDALAVNLFAKRALEGLGAADESGPDQPRLIFSKSEYFRRPLPADVTAELVRMLGRGRVRGESRELNLTPSGGAYNRVPADTTAFAHRDERYLIEHVLIADPDAPAVGREWVTRSWATVHPWGSGRVYPNFPDPDLANWAEAYHGGNYERLQRVKRTYDPDRVFRFEQSL